MKFLGEGDKIVDCSKQENLDQRVFEFCTKKEDYFLNYFSLWERTIGDVYQVRIGNHAFDIGAGLYVFIGCEDADGDWAIIDEIIGRDLQVFMMNTGVSEWDFKTPRLNQLYENVEYYFPQTRNPMPIVSNDGEKIIMVSVVDQYRSTNNRDHLAMFLI